jgi:hypothetical protein
VRRRYAAGEGDREGGERFRLGSESVGSGVGSRIAEATSMFPLSVVDSVGSKFDDHNLI